MPSIDRRHFLGAAVASLAGGVGTLRLGTPSDPEPAATATGWHRPRRDARNTASTTDPGPASDGTTDWKRTVRTNDSGGFDGLALWNDTLLVSSRRELVALDAETGNRRWSFEPDEFRLLDSSPYIRDGTAFFAVGGLYVYALSLGSRRPRWRYRTNGSINALALAGNTLCFESYVDGHQLVALDTETGRERWRNAGRWYRTAASGETLVGARRRGSWKLVALDLATGATRWTRDLADVSLALGTSTVCLEDRVIATGRHGTAVLDLETGDVLRTIEDVADTDGVAVDTEANRLYAADRYDETVIGIDLDGTDGWTVDAAAEAGISVGDETVYVARPDGLLGLDAATGDRRFVATPDEDDRRLSSERVRTTPLIAGESVYHRIGDTVYEVTSRE